MGLSRKKAVTQTKSGIQPSSAPKMLAAQPVDALRNAIEEMINTAVAAKIPKAPSVPGASGVAGYRAHAMQEFVAHELTPKEIEIACYVLQGRSNEEIVETAELSIKTVKHHIGSIYRKFKVDSRAQFAARIFPIGP